MATDERRDRKQQPGGASGGFAYTLERNREEGDFDCVCVTTSRGRRHPAGVIFSTPRFSAALKSPAGPRQASNRSLVHYLLDVCDENAR